MATKTNRSTASDVLRSTTSTFELRQELRDKKRRELNKAPPKPKPDTFKIRRGKGIIA